MCGAVITSYSYSSYYYFSTLMYTLLFPHSTRLVRPFLSAQERNRKRPLA